MENILKKGPGTDGKSFTGRIWRIVAAFLVLVVLFFSVNVSARYVLSQQMKSSVESIADSYVKEIGYRFDAVDNYLSNLAFFDSDVASANFKYKNNHLGFIKSAQNVNDKLNSYCFASGDQFHFMVYYAGHDYFNMSDRGFLSSSELNDLKGLLRDFMAEDKGDIQAYMGTEWKILPAGDKWYAVNYSYYHEVYACGFVELKNLEELVNRIEFGENNHIAFVSGGGIFYTHKEDVEHYRVLQKSLEEIENVDFFGYRYFLVGREIPEMDCALLLVVENTGDVTGSMIMQWFLLVIMLIGAAFMVWVSYYGKKALLDPLRSFFDNLGRISENEESAYFENSEIVELQRANKLYKKILEQARQLKIEVYEKTEEQQRLQIEYMQLQIQPHFYINCMNMIYNMSCMGDDEGVQKMASHVSDYFRYIFGNNQDKVKLTEELKHIGNYLEICKIRYRLKLDYRIQVPNDLSGIVIPPLFLHTCVENSVKYGCRQGDISMIAIRVVRDGDYVTVEVTDDGPGFEPGILQCLERGDEIVTDRGTRVGIGNMMKRMKLIYGDNCRIRFSNRAEGGARVSFQIPDKAGYAE